mgnify:FL=1
MTYNDILQFWYTEIAPRNWFIKDLEFDTMLKRRFEHVHQRAGAGELANWRHKPLGRLAEVIVLDQFSRNLFRNSSQAFAYDAQALALAQAAITAGHDSGMLPQQKSFLYMPFMHSESALIHEQAEQLFNQPGLENNYEFELRHKVIIDQFGRYPHRNELLGRASTPQELQFLRGPESSF